MPFFKNTALALLLLSASLVSARAAETPLPDAIAAPVKPSCSRCMRKARRCTNAIRLRRQDELGFREPIATLLADGKTVGRHYAGPNWEHSDGSAVVGKAAGNAPGTTANDIPWLKLEVISHRGTASSPASHGAADQHGRRQARGRVRQGRHLQERALLRGLRVPAQG